MAWTGITAMKSPCTMVSCSHWFKDPALRYFAALQLQQGLECVVLLIKLKPCGSSLPAGANATEQRSQDRI